MRTVRVLAVSAFGFALAAYCDATASAANSPGADGAIAQVFADFNSCNVPQLVARYSPDDLVFFTGSTPRPISTRSELADYFSYLSEAPCADPGMPKHQHIRLQLRPMAPGVAIVHANTVVTYAHDGKPQERPFYFTFVLKAGDTGWLVVSQDAHPVQTSKE